jgi:hypothetical protein
MRDAALTMLFAASIVIGAVQAAAGQEPARATGPMLTPAQPAVGGFGVVLVLGDLKAEQTGDALPSSAQRVLADMKEFLPYRSYRMLDSQWTRGDERMTSRLRGLDGQEYELRLQSRRTVNGVSVIFQLQEAGTTALSEREQDLAFQRAADRLVAAEQRIAELRQRHNANHPDVVAAGRELSLLRAEVDAVQHARAARSSNGGVRAPVIDTIFQMNVGETVVVGTSRLHGDKALIVLLTAAR